MVKVCMFWYHCISVVPLTPCSPKPVSLTKEFSSLNLTVHFCSLHLAKHFGSLNLTMYFSSLNITKHFSSLNLTMYFSSLNITKHFRSINLTNNFSSLNLTKYFISQSILEVGNYGYSDIFHFCHRSLFYDPEGTTISRPHLFVRRSQSSEVIILSLDEYSEFITADYALAPLRHRCNLCH